MYKYKGSARARAQDIRYLATSSFFLSDGQDREKQVEDEQSQHDDVIEGVCRRIVSHAIREGAEIGVDHADDI